MRKTGSRPIGYVVAVLSVAAAAAIVLSPVVGKGAVAVPFFAVLVSAWYGGLGPGLFATALISATAVAVETYRGNDLQAWRVVQNALFVTGGVVVTMLVEGLHAARRRAEESGRWLSAILTSIGDAVIATDADGRVTFTNPVARSLTGWAEDAARGRPLGEVFPIISETDRRPAENPVTRVIREGVVLGLANSTLLIARDGSERPIADSAAPIKDDAGEVSGAVLVFRDVTEQKRAEHELREADRRKDEFLAMLAHELRNPLAAIGSAVDVAKGAGWEETPGWTREVIERQVRHLARLVDDLLDVSRVSRGKIELRSRVLELATVLDGAVQAVRPLADERGHALDVSYPGAGLRVKGDPTRLEQVVVNLLTNAIKYTESGGRIVLSADRAGRFVVVSVRDSGIGIPPEQIPRMFDLFAQGDRALARSEGGLGIGLTLVKALTEMHGGDVVAESAGRDRGSEFSVRLPATDEPAEHPRTPPPAGSPAWGTRRILVVDDNVDTARGMSRLLTRLGQHVVTAHDGPSALDEARAFHPDFVLLDIGLPGMDGYQVARRMRESGRTDAVIIAVSGYGRDEDRRRSKDAGIDHHLVKPVDFEALVALIGRSA